MLLWFVDVEYAAKAREETVLIEESRVEIDPAKVSSGVANKNVDLSCIRKYFTDDAWKLFLILVCLFIHTIAYLCLCAF